ncbi:serine protease HTRA3 isoform X5 [Diabrotica virgifera virgifera]|uniref:Serine protease HTRA3-like n=1 Tax=Diabrotica virgifera virgifera TaxID=50390 RepID=A0ABM5ILK3_DIAVI|nr:serine protease HTRA3 isoform X5 [Diabrotica virgifera virgifera]
MTSQKACTLLLIAIIATYLKEVQPLFTQPDGKPCNAHSCENLVLTCPVYFCKDDQIMTVVPEYCRCCPYCFNKLHEGDKCGDNDEAICDQGLTCRNNVCRKEAEPL